MTELADDSIGTRIKQEREQSGLSLSELASQTGVSKSYLWNLEHKPQHQRPSGETLYAIAKALNVTMSSLLGRQLLTEPSEEIDDTLRAFAKKHKLPDGDVRMLASIKWRGTRPATEERWEFVYRALQSSHAIDTSALNEHKLRR